MENKYQPFWIALVCCIVVFALGTFARHLVARNASRKEQVRSVYQNRLIAINAQARVEDSLLATLLAEELPAADLLATLLDEMPPV